MIDLSGFGVDADFWQAMASVFFLVLLAKALRSEQRILMMGMIAAVLVPSPASCYVVGIMALFLRAFDFIRGS